MGMSASQARFLGLTARKSNVEYEGQQINQQRMSLANESAGLIQQMSALTVPTPPSAVDFYSLRYSYVKDGINYSITKYESAGNGTYNLSVQHTTPDGTVGVGTPIPSGSAIKYTTETDYATTNPEDRTFDLTIGNNTYQVVDNGRDAAGRTHDSDPDNYVPSYSYSIGDTTYYVPHATFTAPFGSNAPEYDEGVTLTSTMATQYNASGQVIREEISNATFDDDATGKFDVIYLSDEARNQRKGIVLSQDEVNDDIGYSQAFEDYKYKKAVYERTVADINARTAIIQQQDKVLEMRLKQLDTEQEALTQEMDAIKKVIDKNVETTFKTFG